MDPRIYKKIEVTGTSTNSIEEAIQNAITKAGETIRHMRWFEVTETRGNIQDSQVIHWQVTIKIGFHIEG